MSCPHRLPPWQLASRHSTTTLMPDGAQPDLPFASTGHVGLEAGALLDSCETTSRTLLYVPRLKKMQPTTTSRTPLSFGPEKVRPGTSRQSMSPGPMKQTKLPVVAPMSSKIKLISGNRIATTRQVATAIIAKTVRTARVLRWGHLKKIAVSTAKRMGKMLSGKAIVTANAMQAKPEATIQSNSQRKGCKLTSTLPAVCSPNARKPVMPIMRYTMRHRTMAPTLTISILRKDFRSNSMYTAGTLGWQQKAKMAKDNILKHPVMPPLGCHPSK
mmetsp:Transcript_48108/g.123857  ORF Transcript_48108/g.123857 Transcript_48108/m.123857 type:complete len:272 (-) Transcript_48108:1024-1839(-)